MAEPTDRYTCIVVDDLQSQREAIIANLSAAFVAHGASLEVVREFEFATDAMAWLQSRDDNQVDLLVTDVLWPTDAEHPGDRASQAPEGLGLVRIAHTLTPRPVIAVLSSGNRQQTFLREVMDAKPDVFAFHDHDLPGPEGRGWLDVALRLLQRLRGTDPVAALATSARASDRRVVIGHGRSGQWRVLNDFLRERLNIQVDEFNRVPPAGYSNTQRLDEMAASGAFAFLVMTAEDELTDGTQHARLNVVHEVGFFQAKFGWPRAIVMLEEGCEEFSNISGLGQVRFPKDNIRASFEEVRHILEREKLI
jgi:hypothetical protein